MDDNSRLSSTRIWLLALAETAVWAALFYSFPALLPHWDGEPGWSATGLAPTFSLALVVAAVVTPIAGAWIDRGNGRLIMGLGACWGALACVLLSTVDSQWAFGLCWLGIGIAQGLCLYEACFAVLTRLQGPSARGAITIITLVAGLASTLAFPLMHAVVDLGGWRQAMVVNALLALLGGIAFLGLLPKADPGPPRRQRLRWGPVLRQPHFHLLAAGFALVAIDHAVLMTFMLPLLQERGLSAGHAVLAASCIGPMQVLGRIGMITVARRRSSLQLAIIASLACAGAAFVLLLAGLEPWLVLGFVMLQGAGFGMTSIVRPTLIADVFGRGNFGAIAGAIAVPVTLGYAAAPSLAALSWRMGGAQALILLALLASTLAGFLIIATRRAGRPVSENNPPPTDANTERP